MEIKKAEKMAHQLMEYHHLYNWTFGLNNNKTFFGKCIEGEFIRRIELSKEMTKINNKDDVKDTILHEIAHALVGAEEKHSKKWKKTVKEIGGTPERISIVKNAPKCKFKGYCPKCKQIIYRHRRDNIMCKWCKKTIIWKENK